MIISEREKERNGHVHSKKHVVVTPGITRHQAPGIEGLLILLRVFTIHPVVGMVWPWLICTMQP